MNHEAIKQGLLDPRRRHHCQAFECPPDEPGVYGLFAQEGRDDAFEDLGLRPCKHRLLYVGIATSSLATRYHPAEASSRTSSPRLSFGALLCKKLGLEMLPRSADALAHWEFEPRSEARLSSWMKEKLAYAWVSLSKQDAKIAEPMLIRELTPPMNIRLVGDVDRSRLTNARQRCKRLARSGGVTQTARVRVQVSLPSDMAERLDALAANRKADAQDLIIEAVRFLIDQDE